jgi:hypothetical protein
MRLTVLTALCLVVAATAATHPGSPAWTEAKAGRVTVRDAAVRLPRSLAMGLADELGPLVARYRTLEQFAYDEGDHQAASIIHNLRYRYSSALKKVEGGLEVAHARCDGTGSAVGGDRFRHFGCAVTSDVLTIPSAELVYTRDDALPSVVEGAPRRLGPFDARLFVHVTGSSSIAYRQSTDSESARR